MAVPSVNLTLDKGTDFDATFTVTNSDGSPLILRNYYDVIITQTTTNKTIKVFEGMILVNNTVSV